MLSMKLISLLGNSQRLDGGAMFGNAPRILWSKWLTPDENNCVKLSCRCLLIQHEGKNILLETGIGAFFEPKLKERYGVIEEEHILIASLSKHKLSHEEIDYIILSHLHFDHAGGLLSKWQPNQRLNLLFPNARYIVSQKAWERATRPHPRDQASFIPELNQLLIESNRLDIISPQTSILGSGFKFHTSDGHTPGMLLTEITALKNPIVFAADLIPALAWLHLPITMGYDRFPELVVDEKKNLLDYIIRNKGRIFFTHDPDVALATIYLNNKGRYEAINTISDLDEAFNYSKFLDASQ